MDTEKCKLSLQIDNGSSNDYQVNKMESSGIDVVLTTSLYAIIGAIALQKGGDVAARVAREKVLKPLGIL